jgi:putative flavoprotein involved in K+ transport
MRTIDTVVVGAGQAGLTMSWHLQKAGRDHVVLDRRAGLGGGWQDRWDAFRLVSPNWTASFAGHPYDGSDPDGFMPRDEIAGRVAGYAAAIGAPVELATEVRRLRLVGDRFRLETSGGPLEARNVVVATGGFHVPHRPPVAEQVPAVVVQLHSQQYRRPSDLPAGAVLVVGSGQSGVQIAEELQAAGRRVFLSVGSAGRLPRRYRGSDTFRWLVAVAERGDALGTPLPTADRLPDPRLRLAGNPHCSGHGGGHDTNLRRLAADGMTLLGRIDAVDGARLRLAPDMTANLAWADRFFDERFRGLFDAFIERAGIDAPPDDRVPFEFEPPVLTELDLRRAGITSVVWTTGYRLDYAWIELPILDELGFPRQVDGASEVPGLFFLGSLWQRTQASSTLFGVDVDARRLAVAMGLPAVA